MNTTLEMIDTGNNIFKLYFQNANDIYPNWIYMIRNNNIARIYNVCGDDQSAFRQFTEEFSSTILPFYTAALEQNIPTDVLNIITKLICFH
jgi:hypothetical protein